MAGVNWKGESVLDTAYLLNSNTEAVHPCTGKLLEVWVVLWRHMVGFQDCRQTQSADLLGEGGRNGFTCNPCLPAMLCKVFIQNTKLHLPAHVKEGTQLAKGENNISAVSYEEPDTRAPVNTLFSKGSCSISFLRLFLNGPQI